MLKIRISGSKKELRQIAHKVGSTSIKRFRHEKGNITFAIDVQISVQDFLENMDIQGEPVQPGNNDSINDNCAVQEIKTELESLLQEMADK